LAGISDVLIKRKKPWVLSQGRCTLAIDSRATDPGLPHQKEQQISKSQIDPAHGGLEGNSMLESV
jgi:hypothetical protein